MCKTARVNCSSQGLGWVLQALQQRLEELGDEVAPEQKKELNAVFEKLGYSDSGIKA